MPADPRALRAEDGERSCTCHPSEAPYPCAKKYAFSECVAATPPTTRALLEAHDPALLKALVEWHDNPERYDAYLRLCLLIRGALIPPPAPQVTEARATLADGWWA